MILGEVPQILIDAGTVAGIIISCAVAFGLLSRFRPFRWLWRQLVAGPVSAWFRKEVREVVVEELEPMRGELSNNSGSSLKDVVQATNRGVRDLQQRVKRIEDDRVLEADRRHTRQRETDRRHVALELRLDDGDGRMGRIENGLGELLEMKRTEDQ